MRSYINRFMFICILLSRTIHTHAAHNTSLCGSVSPTFLNRSQVPTTMYKLIGMADKTHRPDMECLWGTDNVALEYTRSFRPKKLAHCLFGNDLVSLCDNNCTNRCANQCDTDCARGDTILIQGNCVQDRHCNAWLADYFYLPTDFQGSITFNPHISNVNIPFDFYLGLDTLVSHLYLRTYGSITHTRWHLDPHQRIIDSGTNAHPAGYFTPDVLPNNQLLSSALDFFAGNTVTTTDTNQAVIFEGLQYGRISRCAKTQTNFADLTVELGWDLLSDCDYHVGLGFLFKAPTGNRREACYAFAPVVGNGKHWEVGGVITGHYTFWRNCDETKSFGIHVDTNLTHILSAHEQLTFDLKCKPNSRYMLAQRMGTNVANELVGLVQGEQNTTAFIPAEKQFYNLYAPVANLTTFNANVKYNLQADLSTTINYTTCNWSFDLGYNVWNRSCNDISLDECVCTESRLLNECWVLKGNQRNYGYIPATITNTRDFLALSASQSQATIHSGTNPEVGGTDCLTNNNTNIDNPQQARTTSINPTFLLRIPNGTSFANNIINTSIQPITLTINDVDFIQQRGISHRIFGHINYTWDHACWSPYFGIGAYAEFGKTETMHCNLDCNSTNCAPTTPAYNPICSDTCADCALSQWGVWMKLGLSWD